MIFVFLSFLFGLSNFVDTLLRLMFLYMMPFKYPLATSLKPLFFVLQALCLIGFLLQMRFSNKPSINTRFSGLLNMHLIIFATTILLFFFYETINPGKYGIIFYTGSIWFICYVTGLSITCFWFFSKLSREPFFRTFSIVFLLVGLAFFTKFLNEIYFWPQTLFGFSLPSDIERVTMLSPAIFMGLALFYTWIRLSTRENVCISLSSIFKSSVVIITLLLPIIWNNYKDSLINMIIRAIIYWGLGYSGYGWYFISLYLTAFVAYLFLVKALSKRLDRSTASYLILLGVISFPWNGLMVFDFGYSSILGNILSLDALITGFFMLSRYDKLIKPNSPGILDALDSTHALVVTDRENSVIE